MTDSIADIAVVTPVRQLFSYRVPAALQPRLTVGMGVRVPFGRRRLGGVVVRLRRGAVDGLKEVLAPLADEAFFDPVLLEICCWAADYYRYPVGQVLRGALPSGLLGEKTRSQPLRDKLYRPGENSAQPRGEKQRQILALVRDAGEASLSFVRQQFSAPHAVLDRLVEQGYLTWHQIEKLRDPFLNDPVSADQPLSLNAEQTQAKERLVQALDRDEFGSFLLQGVTGSGKTEVYLQTIAELFNRKRQGLVLVPEIALTPQLVGRFRARFEQQGIRIAVLHSGLSGGERFDAWRQIARDDVDIVIGARSAVFAPLRRLGLIIVDEEHDASYKQGEGFRYNARDLALLRGQRSQCPVVLGSATPSLASAWRCEQGQMQRLRLTQRAHAGALPKVDLVDMTGQSPEVLLSEALQTEIEITLSRQKQVMLLLNRRGFSPFLLCSDCGQSFRCPNCEITLTYHQRERQLRCHYCDFIQRPPDSCPQCHGYELDPQGFGTERLEEILTERFPQARIARMDRDTTGSKGAHQRLVKRMLRGEIDILVGTQMIAKGHDFPDVELVGVLASDSVLNLPDFRAAERIFSLLTQVAGRAGRSGGGRVLIQTYSADHYALMAAAAQDYDAFYALEIEFRKALGYPPQGFLANLVLAGNLEQRTSRAAEEIAALRFQGVEVLGPSPCPLYRLRGKFRVQILLKAAARAPLHRHLEQVEGVKLPHGVSLSVDVDPLDMF